MTADTKFFELLSIGITVHVFLVIFLMSGLY